MSIIDLINSPLYQFSRICEIVPREIEPEDSSTYLDDSVPPNRSAGLYRGTHPGHTKFLLDIRNSRNNPKNPAEFLDFINSIIEPTTFIKNMLKMHKTSQQDVLRKLCRSLLPKKFIEKQKFVREILLLPYVDITEGNMTFKNYVPILRAICKHAPEYAHIPKNLYSHVPGRAC